MVRRRQSRSIVQVRPHRTPPGLQEPPPAAEVAPGAIIPAGQTLLARPGPQELLAAFLGQLQPATLRAYRRDLEDLAEFCGGRLFAPDHRPDVAGVVAMILAGGHGAANRAAGAWQADMRRRKLSPPTINRRLAALRAVVRLGRSWGIIAWEIDVRSLRVESYRDTRGPGLEAVRRILAAAADPDRDRRHRDVKQARDVAILRVLFDLALRRAELVALDLGDLELPGVSAAPLLAGAQPPEVGQEHGRIWILGKGRTQKQALTLPEITARALAAWLAIRGGLPAAGGPALFLGLDPAGKGDGRLTAEGVYKLVRHYGRLAGLDCHPHALRHTAITAAVRAAGAARIGIEEVLPYSRHKNLSTLMIYYDRERDMQGKLAEMVAGKVGK